MQKKTFDAQFNFTQNDLHQKMNCTLIVCGWRWKKTKVPPKITPFEFAKDVNVGDRVSVQCVVGTGDLPLAFKWLKDNIPLNTGVSSDEKSTRKSMSNNDEGIVTIRQNDEFSSALSINSLKPNQGGTYVCIVENDAAKETYSALLRVNGKIYGNPSKYVLIKW